MKSELLLGNIPNLQIANVNRILKTFFGDAVEFQLDLVTERLLQVDQPYASHKVVLAVSRSYLLPGGIVPSLKDYDEDRNIVQNIFVVVKSIPRVFL